MPFVDTNDGVSLGEKSFATWHEALDHYESILATNTRISRREIPACNILDARRGDERL